MSAFEVTFQLVDSPVDESQSGGAIGADGLLGSFHDFPFASELARARDGATFPTITFRRQSDGEEVAVWTDNAVTFDMCLVNAGKRVFVNDQTKAQVEEILTRFRYESVATIRPQR